MFVPPRNNRPEYQKPPQSAAQQGYGNPHIGGKGQHGGPWSWGSLAGRVGSSWQPQQGMPQARPAQQGFGMGGGGNAPAPSLPSFDALLAMGGGRPMQRPFFGGMR